MSTIGDEVAALQQQMQADAAAAARQIVQEVST